MQQTSERTENYVRDFLQIFFSQKRSVFLTAFVVLALAAAYAAAAPERYAANGSILLRSNEYQRSPAAIGDDDPKLFRVEEQDLRSEREIILSPVVIDGAIDRLKQRELDFAQTLSRSQVLGNLSVDLVPASKVLEVRLIWASAEQAVALLDAVFTSYINRRNEIQNPAGAAAYFASQVDNFREQIREGRNQLVEVTSQVTAADPEQEIAHNLLLRERLLQKLSELKGRQVELDSELSLIDSLLSQDQVRLFSFINLETISDLSRQLVELSIERGTLARNYDDESRMVSAIDKQILETAAQLRREASDYRDTLASQLDSVGKQIELLSAEAEQIQQRNYDLQLQSVEAESVRRELDLLEDSFAAFFQRRQESALPSASDSALTLFFVSILSPPHTSGNPVSPNRPFILFGGAFGGLLLGFTIGFLREFADHSFKVPRDVEQFLGVGVLFSVPVKEQG